MYKNTDGTLVHWYVRMGRQIGSTNVPSEFTSISIQMGRWYVTKKLLNVSRIPTIFPSVVIDGKLIQPSDSVRNLCIIMDSNLSFGQHIDAISKSADYHLRRIGNIKKCIALRVLLEN